MCCFSGKVDSVTNTNIFARAVKGGNQFLVYSMQFKAGSDLAMILPIPTPKDSKEDAVKFINLEKYENFFDDLHKAFPVPKSDPDRKLPPGNSLSAKPIVVVEVGKFAGRSRSDLERGSAGNRFLSVLTPRRDRQYQ